MSAAPLYNLETEKYVLGACLVRPAAVDEISDVLTAAAFYRDIHGTIWDAILHVHGAGSKPDLVTVRDRLAVTGELDRVGGPAYVASLTDGMPRSTNAVHYADIVVRFASRRRLVRLAGDPETSPADIRAEAERLDETAATPRPLYKIAEAALQPTNPADVIPTGIGPLDVLFGTGLRRGEVVTVAARPSHGKTAFGLAVAANATRRGVRTAFVSMEMDGEGLFLRLIAAEGRYPLRQLRRGEVSKAAVDVATRLVERPLNVLETVRTVGGIARQLKQEPETRLVVIDYAQLLDAGTQAMRYGSRVQEIATISRDVKRLATVHRVAVLMLSQLNREVERRGDQRPRLSDLRESGSLEQDSDIVVGLYRPAMAPGAEDDPNVNPRCLTADVLKNRQGPSGARVPLHFDPETQRLHAEQPEPAAISAGGD